METQKQQHGDGCDAPGKDRSQLRTLNRLDGVGGGVQHCWIGAVPCCKPELPRERKRVIARKPRRKCPGHVFTRVAAGR